MRVSVAAIAALGVDCVVLNKMRATEQEITDCKDALAKPDAVAVTGDKGKGEVEKCKAATSVGKYTEATDTEDSKFVAEGACAKDGAMAADGNTQAKANATAFNKIKDACTHPKKKAEEQKSSSSP